MDCGKLGMAKGFGGRRYGVEGDVGDKDHLYKTIFRKLRSKL